MNENESQLNCEELLLERHRKEKKELNEKITNLRHAIKGDKKKKKEINSQIESLELSLKSKHEKELKDLKLNNDSNKSVNELTININNVSIDSNQNDLITNTDFTKGIKYNEIKISKAQRKRDAKALKERQKQSRIDNEVLNDCDNPRLIETQKLKSILDERQLVVHEISSDGDCMYRAIEHQLSLRDIKTNIEELRLKTSDYMKTNREEFLPFLTSNKSGDLMSHEEYEDYCNEIANTKSWGGQLELRALSHVLKTSIEVIQAEGTNVSIGNSEYKSNKPLLLSYHRHAYRLGEHYNSLTQIMD